MDLPPFDNSAMDGYAVRLADLTGSGPWTLKLAGRIAAGDDAGDELAKPGAAVRIFTGANVPRDFDAVVMQENCTRNGDFIILEKRPSIG